MARQWQRSFFSKTLSLAYSVAKTLPATQVPALLGARVIAGPVENYSARSLWAACLPLDPETAGAQAEERRAQAAGAISPLDKEQRLKLADQVARR